VPIYINDILILTDSVEQNLKVFRFYYRYITMSSKLIFLSQLFKKQIEYLGYIIDKNGITLSQRHVSTVKDFPILRNAHKLQKFLGLINYFRKFFVNLAISLIVITKPLCIVKEDRFLHFLYTFDDKCLHAFNILKSALISKPVLCHYDPTRKPSCIPIAPQSCFRNKFMVS